MLPDTSALTLRNWRESLDMTQADLAKRLLTSHTEISDYELGNRRPNLDRAFALEQLSGGVVPARLWARPVRRQIRRG